MVHFDPSQRRILWRPWVISTGNRVFLSNSNSLIVTQSIWLPTEGSWSTPSFFPESKDIYSYTGTKVCIRPRVPPRTRFGNVTGFQVCLSNSLEVLMGALVHCQPRSPSKLAAFCFRYIQRMTFWCGTDLDHGSFPWVTAPVPARTTRGSRIIWTRLVKLGFFWWKGQGWSWRLGRGLAGPPSYPVANISFVGGVL